MVWTCEAKRRTHSETSTELGGGGQKTTRKAKEDVEKGGAGRYEDAEHHGRDGYGQAAMEEAHIPYNPTIGNKWTLDDDDDDDERIEKEEFVKKVYLSNAEGPNRRGMPLGRWEDRVKRLYNKEFSVIILARVNHP